MPLPWTYRRAKSKLHADRLAVCRVLRDRGPMLEDDAAAALGWDLSRWWRVVEGATDFLRITGRGWALTSAGREAIR